MAKMEEKAKVGRPRLADPELIKDSWYRVAASLSIVLMLVMGGLGILTAQITTSKGLDNAKASVVNVKKKNVRVIPAKTAETRIINVDGTVTRIIPAK